MTLQVQSMRLHSSTVSAPPSQNEESKTLSASVLSTHSLVFTISPGPQDAEQGPAVYSDQTEGETLDHVIMLVKQCFIIPPSTNMHSPGALKGQASSAPFSMTLFLPFQKKVQLGLVTSNQMF